MTIRVLLADDNAAIRAGLRHMLQAAPDIEVVAEAGDGAAALTNARATRPDVVLMDLRMPGIDGITATREIVGEGLAEVLVLTTYDLDEYVYGALRAGAVGFHIKTVEAADLVDAVRRIAAGEGVRAPEVTRRLLGVFVARGGAGRERAAPRWLDELTERERQVLTHLAEGARQRRHLGCPGPLRGHHQVTRLPDPDQAGVQLAVAGGDPGARGRSGARRRVAGARPRSS